MFRGLFPQKSPIISVSVVESDLHVTRYLEVPKKGASFRNQQLKGGGVLFKNASFRTERVLVHFGHSCKP